MNNYLAESNKDRYNNGENYEYLKERWHKIRIEKSVEIIRKYKNIKNNNLKALDVGCGNGYAGEKIINLGVETYGIDVSTDELKKAKEKGIKITEGNFQDNLPYESDFFDIVFLGEVIEHIPDPRQFLSEINRVLKIGGLLVVTTPNLAGLDNRFRLLFGRIPRCIDPLSGHHYLHVRPFTFSSIKKFLKRGGFMINTFTSNRIKFGFVDSYFLANYFPGLGATLIIGATKERDIRTIELNKD